MWPQVGEAAFGSVPGVHAVPAPTQCSIPPSPVANTSDVGVAVAVTLSPGTDAVADRAPHDPGSSQSHTGVFTSTFVAVGGFQRINGDGSRNAFTASAANNAAFGGPFITRNLVIAKFAGGTPHDPMYHWPGGAGGAGGGNRSGYGANSAAVIGRQ